MLVSELLDVPRGPAESTTHHIPFICLNAHPLSWGQLIQHRRYHSASRGLRKERRSIRLVRRDRRDCSCARVVNSRGAIMRAAVLVMVGLGGAAAAASDSVSAYHMSCHGVSQAYQAVEETSFRRNLVLQDVRAGPRRLSGVVVWCGEMLNFLHISRLPRAERAALLARTTPPGNRLVPRREELWAYCFPVLKQAVLVVVGRGRIFGRAQCPCHRCAAFFLTRTRLRLG